MTLSVSKRKKIREDEFYRLRIKKRVNNLSGYKKCKIKTCNCAHTPLGTQIIAWLCTTGLVSIISYVFFLNAQLNEHTRRINEVCTELNYRKDKAIAILVDPNSANPVDSAKTILTSDNLLPNFMDWKYQALLYELDDAVSDWNYNSYRKQLKVLKTQESLPKSKPELLTQLNMLTEILEKVP